MSDLVGALAEVRNLYPRTDAAAHYIGGAGETPQRSANAAREQDRQDHHDAGGDQEHAHNDPALGFDRRFDLAALSREQQHAG